MSIARLVKTMKLAGIFNKYSAKAIFPSGEHFRLRQLSSRTSEIDNIFSTKITNDTVKVQFESKLNEFPFVWLRDNCQCEKCFHGVSKTRTISYKTFNVNVNPKSVSINEDKKSISILWDDEHSSTFESTWLQERSFTTESNERYLNSEYMPRKKTWNGDTFHQQFYKFNFDDLINEDECLQKWIRTLAIYGATLITGVPSDLYSSRKLANRVEFIKKTLYGSEFFVTEKSNAAATNVAYLSGTLQPHTDLPYYEHHAGIVLLHCITQAVQNGGDNMLADGLYIANYLKENNKEYYKILAETFVNWEDIGEEDGRKFHTLYRSPIICENTEGEITRLNFSIAQRGSHFNVPLEKVKPWYVTLKHFYDLAYKYSTSYKLAPGEMLCLDNRRMLHGRYGYTDSSDKPRFLVGSYLDWDYLFSRYRVISKNKPK